MNLQRSVTDRRTELGSVTGVYALVPCRPSVIASAANVGVGDGTQPHTRPCRLHIRGEALSHAAIAAVLGRADLPVAERLVALAIGSFAGRDQRAWPRTGTAAVRAGLTRRRFESTLDRLVGRGEVEVESDLQKRGRAKVLRLAFAETGPWWDDEVNVGLVESVLDRTAHRGPARLVLAAHAALADEQGVIDGFATEDLVDAAGLPETTFRRARAALLATGELELLQSGGGRGRTNRWKIHLVGGPIASRATPRPETPPPAAGAGRSGTPPETPPQRRFGAETVPQTLPETPPPHARGGEEALNPRTGDPPDPPRGGRAQQVLVEQQVTTEAGRRRCRVVLVDAAELCPGWREPVGDDHRAWEAICTSLIDRVGEQMFAIWLTPLELVAIDCDEALVVSAPEETRSWVASRFGTAITTATRAAGRGAVIADAAQEEAIRLLWGSRVPNAGRSRSGGALPSTMAVRVERAGDGEAQHRLRRRGRRRSHKALDNDGRETD
jgi:DnaA-like protein